MSDESPRPEKSPLEDLKDRLLDWIDALLHPTVLVPAPVPVRPSRPGARR